MQRPRPRRRLRRVRPPSRSRRRRRPRATTPTPRATRGRWMGARPQPPTHRRLPMRHRPRPLPPTRRRLPMRRRPRRPRRAAPPARGRRRAGPSRGSGVAPADDGTEDKPLPRGPVILSPASLFHAFGAHDEVALRRREADSFKTAVLQNVRLLFAADHNPFWAGLAWSRATPSRTRAVACPTAVSSRSTATARCARPRTSRSAAMPRSARCSTRSSCLLGRRRAAKQRRRGRRRRSTASHVGRQEHAARGRRGQVLGRALLAPARGAARQRRR